MMFPFLVVLFFLNCLALAYLAKSKVSESDSVIIQNNSSDVEDEVLDGNNNKSNSIDSSQDDLVIPD